MAQAVAARGHHVEIFTTDQDGPKGRMHVPTDRPVHLNGVDVHYFRANTLSGWQCTSVALWRALRGRIPDFDIVHSHSLHLFHSAVMGHYCRKYDVPYLMRPCGSMDPYIFNRHRYRKLLLEWLFERRNLKHAAAVNFTTDQEMTLARKSLHFGKGIVVPLGLQLHDHRPTTESNLFRQTFPNIGGKKIILFLGRINFKKGLDILVPAIARIAANRDDIHLVLAGPDTDGYGKQVRKWIDAEGINEITTFVGMLHGEMKMAALGESYVFVLPSYSENFGIAVIEAMGSGLPVVISDQVNIWPAVAEAKAGIVTQCDVLKFSDAINDLIEQPHSAEEMGRCGQLLVSEAYSWPRIAGVLEQNYRCLQAGPAIANDLDQRLT